MKAVKNKSRLFMGLRRAPADFSTVKFILYHGPTFADRSVYDLDDYKYLLEDSNFDKDKTTVMYYHGYLENQEVESIHVIVDAYLKRHDVNLIVLDWGELADGNYLFDAVINAKQLGPEIAKRLLQMFENGLDVDRFHLVGHSLGGQMAGIIGREVYKQSKRIKLKRITALDPAFPPFYMAGLAAHLSAKDAEFVDVIHTDAWYYGAPFSTGTADFWPNAGKTLQPGCPKRNHKLLTDNDLCSHRRSWFFWAESVADEFPNKFLAVKAKNWNDFKVGNLLEDAEKKDVVPAIMGPDCPTDISGDYYLQTNGITPFARGMDGIKYVEPKELIGNTYMEPGQQDAKSKDSEATTTSTSENNGKQITE